MYTYFLKSQEFVKIGKTHSLEERIVMYETHNPSFEILRTLEGDYESEMHNLFKEKCHKNEWFKLEKKDIEYILSDDLLKLCEEIDLRRKNEYIGRDLYTGNEKIKKKVHLSSEVKGLILNRIVQKSKEKELKDKEKRDIVPSSNLEFGIEETIIVKFP